MASKTGRVGGVGTRTGNADYSVVISNLVRPFEQQVETADQIVDFVMGVVAPSVGRRWGFAFVVVLVRSDDNRPRFRSIVLLMFCAVRALVVSGLLVGLHSGSGPELLKEA